MKKVLIIAYYWPPAGGPGVQRWLKFVKYLPEFDLQPIVYVPEDANYPIVDESLLNEVPDNVPIVKQPISEPYRWASFLSSNKTKRISSGIIPKKEKQSLLDKILLYIRGNYFIPDARKSWIKPSVKLLSEFIERENIADIITTGPPHSLHLIGLQLKQKFPQLQWITDFRDPWTSIGYHKKLKLTKSSQNKHKELESMVLNSCDKIIVTSKTTKKEFEAITNKSIQVITNGFDNEFEQVELDKAFTISHIGSLLTDRNPELLWTALAELKIENTSFGKDLELQLIGVVGEDVLESIKKHGLEENLSHLGYISHKEVVQYQQKSQVLLLLEIDSSETQGIIPGKLFEYMNAERPILAIGPEQWEGGEMVDATESGVYVHPHNTDTLKKVLLDWYLAYKDGNLRVSAEGVEKYNRKKLTSELAKFIGWELS